MNRYLLAVASILLVLQGCAKKPEVPAETEDLTGKATACDGPTLELAPGAAGDAAISMSNDGWCSVHVTENDGQPFLLGLVRTRPEHGRLLIQRTFGKTRVEYTPNEQYSGPDRFAVALRPREDGAADAMLNVSVNASPPQSAKPGTAVSP